jgi:hypothetical protein
MSDEVLTIKLTEREIDLLHQCISTNMETVKRRHEVTGATADLLQELGELSDDLLEQLHNRDEMPLEGRTFALAEDEMIQRGMDAREQAKMHSRAAIRRNFNLKVKDKRLSKTQTHDVWDANDPKNW